LGFATTTKVYATQEAARHERGASAKASPAPGAKRAKLAEGEYEIQEEGNSGAVEPGVKRLTIFMNPGIPGQRGPLFIWRT
jgi:hypothetical protein